MAEEWFEKYRPKQLKEIVGNTEIILQVNKLIKNKNNKFIISGDNGVGKRVITKLILDINNFYYDWFKNCDKKEEAMLGDIENIISKQNSRRCYFKDNKEYALVIDDVEKITTEKEKKMIIALLEHKNKFPIILITSLGYSKFVKKLEKYVTTFKLKKPTKRELLKLLMKIVKNEKLNIDSSLYGKILNFVQGDVRKLVIVLYDLKISYEEKCITKEDIKDFIAHSHRKNMEIDLFSVTKRIINKRHDLDKCKEYYKTCSSQIPPMIYENYHNSISFSQKKHDFKNVSTIKNVLSSISKSDVIDQQIHENQKWILFNQYIYYSCSRPSYLMNKYNNRCSGYRMNIAFDTSTKTKKSNEEKIKKLQECINSKNVSKNISMDDAININNMILKLFKKNKLNKIAEILNNYGIGFSLMKSLLNIDKTKDQIKLTNNAKLKKLKLKLV